MLGLIIQQRGSWKAELTGYTEDIKNMNKISNGGNEQLTPTFIHNQELK